MSYGTTPYGTQAFGTTESSQSVADVIAVLAAQSPAPDLCFVVKAYPYDLSLSSTSEEILSNTDGPASGNPVPSTHANRVINPYSWEVRLPALLTPGALAEPAVGAARFRSLGPIVNTDRDLDTWASYDWTDRVYEVYVGATTGAWPGEFALVFKGSTDRLSYNRGELVIHFRDLRRKLDVALQTTLYAGTGGLEGGDALKDRPRPRAWGQVRQVEPPLVDATNLIYQLNDGAINAVQAVRDQGGDLAFDADYADITTAAPAAGEYATSLATGYVRLGASPAGTVTVDFQGDSDPTYVSTSATIVRRIVGEVLTDPDDLEVGTFIDLDLDAPYTVGYWVGPEEHTILQAVDEILSGIQGWALFSPIGRLAVGRIADPAGEPISAALTDDDVATEEIGGAYERQQASPPHWRFRLPYRQHYQTLAPDNVDAAVSEATRQDYGQPWRWVTGDNASLLTDVPAAREAEIKSSAIDTSTDAQTEADRVQALLEPERSFHTFGLDNLNKLRMFSHQPGEVVSFTGDVYELVAGDKRLIAGMRIDPADRQAVLILWG